MRSDLDHLPERQQDELARVRATLLDEFETARCAGAGGTADWRTTGKVLKIVLFGSYARHDWVDEPDNGYQSDYDLLIVVSHPNLTDIADYWYVAEDKILRDPGIGRTVNIIVHTLAEVNSGLTRGEPFWTDIIRDGIALHDTPGHPFASPKPPTAGQAADMAGLSLHDWLPRVESALKGAAYYRDQAEIRDSVFTLHQATERAYICFLLVHSFYYPRSHNIRFLRSLAEDADKRLVTAWPRDTRLDRRRFELLKRAYVEARYSDHYDVTADDLDALAASCSRLRDLVEALCRERIGQLRVAADVEAAASRP